MKFEFSPEQQEAIRTTFEKAVAEYISELPQMIKYQLDHMIMGALGFEYQYSRWELKHRGPISNYIDAKVHQLVDDALNELDLDKAIQKEHLALIKKTFLEKVNDKVHRNMWDRANKKAEQIMEEMFSGIKIGEFTLKTPSIEEASNPLFASSSLEAALLKRVFEDKVE